MIHKFFFHSIKERASERENARNTKGFFPSVSPLSSLIVKRLAGMNWKKESMPTTHVEICSIIIIIISFVWLLNLRLLLNVLEFVVFFLLKWRTMGLTRGRDTLAKIAAVHCSDLSLFSRFATNKGKTASQNAKNSRKCRKNFCQFFFQFVSFLLFFAGICREAFFTP